MSSCCWFYGSIEVENRFLFQMINAKENMKRHFYQPFNNQLNENATNLFNYLQICDSHLCVRANLYHSFKANTVKLFIPLSNDTVILLS